MTEKQGWLVIGLLAFMFSFQLMSMDVSRVPPKPVAVVAIVIAAVGFIAGVLGSMRER